MLADSNAITRDNSIIMFVSSIFRLFSMVLRATMDFPNFLKLAPFRHFDYAEPVPSMHSFYISNEVFKAIGCKAVAVPSCTV